MKLGINLGFLTSQNLDPLPLALEAERLGYHSVWVAEAWGSDAVSLLAWIGGKTERIYLGSAMLQIPARTPAMTAMTAATLDRLSGGRFLLGLGASGPQVVEGWHGVPYGKPLARTRECVEILRKIWKREEELTIGVNIYDIPIQGGTGLGKPLKIMMPPLRADIPDLPCRHRPEEHRARRRDRGRLATHLLLSLQERRFHTLARGRPGTKAASLEGREIRHRPNRCGSRRRRRLQGACVHSSPILPFTSAEWVHEVETSISI